ncbi:general substrate transporter, partial [Aureobasidium pullulans]
EFELIKSQIVEERSQKSIGYFDLFRGWPNLRRTILVMAIQASCQMTGVSAIQYFSPQIFAQIGIPTSRSLLFQAVNAIIAFAGTTVCILTIDGVGRRPLQIFGHIFLCVTFVINAAIIKVFPTTSNNTSAHWAFVVMTWLFNFVFFLTSGPLSWAIPAELFGTAMRLKGVSWGAMTSFAFNTMIGQVTPIAISSIGWKFYLVFIVCNLTNAIFFWCFQPETKGLNLEDMDELFRDSPTFVPGSKWAPSSYVNELAREIAKGDEVKTIKTQHIEEA